MKPISMSSINHGSSPASFEFNFMEVDRSSGCAAPKGSFPLPPHRTALGPNPGRRVDNRPRPIASSASVLVSGVSPTLIPREHAAWRQK